MVSLKPIRSAPGSSARQRFWFRPGRGETGELPPNGWQSIFGGSAWTRTADASGEPGEWYLHLFAPEQPDLNWTHPDVWAEHEDILRFWFDRGVAGVRIDSAALLVKDAHLSEEGPETEPGEHPFTDRDELHEIYRRWRAIADAYSEPRMLVGEIWLADAERLARYLPPGRASHHGLQLPTSWRVRGSVRARCARRSRRHWRSTNRSMRPQRGSFPTTT